LIFLYPVLFLLGILLAYLVLSLMAGRPLFGWGFPKGKKRRARGKGENAGSGFPKTCPICGSLLEKGQRLKSVVFQGGVKSGNVTEKMSHIFGCPLCYPANDKNLRICPVCKQLVPPEGYLIARMFERSGRERKHVHVLGCTVCRERRRPS
jgi:hypothetical protein